MPSVLSPLPGLGALINGVAINNSGVGLIGGYDDTSNFYAAYANSGGLSPLFQSLIPGQILSVAINDSGVGLIGGEDGSNNLYAAMVQLNGTITPLISSSIGGFINSVAINNAGVGLIGGQSGPEGYAALIAPNGTVTPLDVSSTDNISSVALQSIIDAVVPTSAGPYFSAFYTQLAATSALQSRFIEQNKIWTKKGPPQGTFAFNDVNPYDLGDYAELGECSCGRGLQTIKKILGRRRNMVVLPDGSRHWPRIGSTEFRAIAPIKRFQAVQIDATTLEIRLIVDPHLNENQQASICKLIHHFIGHPFEIRFTYVDAFPPGKFEEFVNLHHSC